MNDDIDEMRCRFEEAMASVPEEHQRVFDSFDRLSREEQTAFWEGYRGVDSGFSGRSLATIANQLVPLARHCLKSPSPDVLAAARQFLEDAGENA